MGSENQNSSSSHNSGLSSSHLGEHIGPYKLISVLGQGGGSMVFLAEQQEPLKRQVALKIIKPGADPKQVIISFEGEKRALALLDHENIARVFDAGMTSDGSPYFVLEYIKGIPITEYCDNEKLGIESRLKLFLNVCEAIQYAHQKGIIHRDIKPSNIMITIHNEKPIPKVIDFGIAKALGQPLDSAIFAEHGDLIGTREYMSPEQTDVLNFDIDTRADVYSLGVLLYVLLAGVLPFDPERLRDAYVAEIQKILNEEVPPAPSVRLTALNENARIAQDRSTEIRKLTRQLSSELEWIPLKALEKQRHERYQSVAEMAGDVRNYLNARPLIAGPKTKTYRLRKFIYRNRLFVFAFAAIMLMFAAAAIISTTFAIRESRARAQAVKSEQKAVTEAQKSKEAQERAERLAYYGIIQTVSAKLVNNDFSQIRPMLEDTDPQRRGWEWGYLMNMCNRPDWALKADPNSLGILGISRGGQIILTAGTKTITLWDIADRKMLWQNSFNHPRWPGYFVFDPAGKFVAVIDKGRLHAFDIKDGHLIFQSEPLKLCCLCIHPDNSKLYAGTEDGNILEFESKSWSVQRSVNFSDQKIWHLAIGSSGTHLLLTAGNLIGQRAIVCDTNSLKSVSSFEAFQDNGIRGLALLDKLNLILVLENSVTYIYSFDSLEYIGSLSGHSQTIFGIAVSPDQKKVVTSSMDGKINIYDTAGWQDLKNAFKQKGSPVSISPDGTVYHGSAVYSVAVLANGHVLSASVDGTLKEWSNYPVQPKAPIKVPACDSSGGYCLDYREDGKKLAVSGWWKCNQIVLFDMLTNKAEYITVEGFDKLIDSRWVRFRPKTAELAVQTSGGLRFYNTAENSNPQTRWIPFSRELNDFVFDPSGKILAVSFIDKGLQLINPDTGSPYPIDLKAENIQSCRMAFSPDGSLLAALDQDRRPSQLYLWDVATGRLVFQHAMPFRDTKKSGIVFHPNGNFLAAGQNNGEIVLWDIKSGQCISVLKGHGEGPVVSLQFSNDGRRLLSGGTDKTLRVWDWIAAKPLLTINQEGYALSARFSPDGLLVASTDSSSAAWIRESLDLAKQ